MLVMLGNHSSSLFHYWAGRYPNRVGWLVGPSAQRKTTLRSWVPYALDNDAFAAWKNGTQWSEDSFFEFLDWVGTHAHKPRWVAVPDVVTDREATLANWDTYAPRCREYGHQLAFVMQDKMTASDIPGDADLVFIGGSYRWKWGSIEWICREFPRVHVGRVNSLQKLRRANELGVESVDGTGWFRRPQDDFRRLELFLNGTPDPQLFLDFEN